MTVYKHEQGPMMEYWRKWTLKEWKKRKIRYTRTSKRGRGKTRGFVVMEGSEKLHVKKEDMVNNQCPLDFITSKSLVTWGSICSIQCIGS